MRSFANAYQETMKVKNVGKVADSIKANIDLWSYMADSCGIKISHDQHTSI